MLQIKFDCNWLTTCGYFVFESVNARTDDGSTSILKAHTISSPCEKREQYNAI